MILSDQVSEFLLEKQRKKSRATADQYRFILEKVFLPWAVATCIYEASDCTDRVMDRFQDHLLIRQIDRRKSKLASDQLKDRVDARRLALASVRTYVRGVRIFLNWSGVAAGRFESVAEPQRLRDTLSREEIQRIERAGKSERDKLIVRVLADCGLRISELLGLRLRDLREDTHNHRCFVRVIGKGNIEREVAIPQDTFRRLRKLAASGDGDWIFLGRRKNRLTKNGAEQLVRRLAEEAKIGRRVWPHLLRHSWCTQQIRAGRMNLVEIQRAMGHRTLAMISQVYAHTTPDDSYDRQMAGLRS